MRLAADPFDPAYNQVAKGCKIFVNGVEMQHLLSADEEAGEVERVKFDTAGNVVIDAYGSVRSETIRGTIRIDLAACEFPAWLIGFDTWMRQRTDRAHAKFMARTSSLPSAT